MSISLTPNTRLLSIPTRLGRLSVRRAGPDDGALTVLWSSMFVDSHTWDEMLLLLRARPDRSFVLIDPPGLGLSEPLSRRSTIAEAAAAAHDALDELAAGRPVDWVGNAFGGHVGYELAAEPGVLRSLAAISSPVEAISPQLRRRIELLAPLLRHVGPVGPVRSAVIDAMLTEQSAADPRLRKIVVESLERPGRRSMSFALRSFILDRVDVSHLMPRIQVPSLFVASDDRGDWSPADAERSAAAAGPMVRSTTVRDARTLVPLEQPEALAAELLAFWDGLPTS
ncbi:alpha/beta hydrolase [Leifsonia sp. YIM 134122]|uniref:Alpha/beta hydrolase n=1 Tax=Leifsonia stereocauli TaxID=3134136 RepID=A0ABU9W318_9MICO